VCLSVLGVERDAASRLASVNDDAAPVVQTLQLTVVTLNVAAIRRCSAAGLREYGLERRSLKIADRFYGDLLMALRLNAAGQGVDQTR
jgi:hypothetical protein